MSEFFSVTLGDGIVMDDKQVSRSSTWSSEQILEEILNHTQGSSSGGESLKYREINDVINLNHGDEITKDYDLGDNTIIVTTLYLDILDGSNFRFQILDKSNNGFILYDSDKVSHYTDSVFIPYIDKDSDTNKLHVKVTSYNLNSQASLNIKILGLEIQKNQ